MKLLKPILLLVLVFAAGIGVGVVGTRVGFRIFMQRAVQHPEFLRFRVERQLDRRLRLDGDQRSSVHETLMRAQRELRDLRLEVQPRRRAIMERAKNEVSAVLTPEQRRKLEEIIAQNQAWWGPP